MEPLLKTWTLHVASGIEAGAGVVIGIASVIAVVRSFILFARKPERQDKKEVLRLQLGRWLAVGLEIELAADILRTAVAPTWTEIGQLGAIIALRTVLNYFLQKDIDKAVAREQTGKTHLAPEGHLKGPVAA